MLINELNVIKTTKFKTYNIFFLLSMENESQTKQLLLSNFLEYLFEYNKIHISFKSSLYYSKLESSIFKVNGTDNICLKLSIPDTKFTEENINDTFFDLFDISLKISDKDNYDSISTIFRESKNYTLKKVSEIDSQYISKKQNPEINIYEIKDLSFNSFIEFFNYYIKDCFTKLYIIGDVDNDKLNIVIDDSKLPKIKNMHDIYQTKKNSPKIIVNNEKTFDSNSLIILVYHTNPKDIIYLESNILADLIIFKQQNSLIHLKLKEIKQYIYHLNSILDYETGNLYIYTFTNNKNQKKLIKEIITLIKSITIQDLKDFFHYAKETRITQLNAIEDSPIDIFDKYIQNQKNAMPISLKSHILLINNINYNQIYNALSNWELHEIHLTGDIKDEYYNIEEFI